MKTKTDELYTRYFHTLIDTYQDELNELDVTVKDIDDVSEREKRFNELLPKIEKEFEIFKDKGLFLIINKYDCLKGKETFVCFNTFTINYLHDGYNSRIQILIIDAINNNHVDVTTNCNVVNAYDKDVKFIDILKELMKE